MVSMKFCPSCGAELDDDSMFCGACGKPAVQSSTQAEISSENVTASDSVISEGGFVFSEDISKAVSADLSKELAEKSRRKRKRRNIILITAAVVLLAAIVACILIFTSPKYKIMRAFDNTMDDLASTAENCENYAEFAEIFNDLSKSGQYETDIGIDFGVVMQYYYSYFDYYEVEEGISAKVHTNYDNNARVLNGNLDLTVEMEGVEIPVNILYSANDEQTMFSAPSLLDKTFSIDNQTFGADFLDSFIYRAMDIEIADEDALRDLSIEPFTDTNEAGATADAISAEIKDFMRSIDIEKSDVCIPGFEGDVYHLSFTGAELEALITDIIKISSKGNEAALKSEDVQDLLELIRNADFNVNLGIAGSKLTAVSIQVNDGEAFSIVLSGDDNIWSSIDFYDGSDKVMNGSITATPVGLNARFEPIDVDEAIVLIVDDNAGKVSIVYEENGSKHAVADFTYEAADGSASMSFEFDPVFLNDYLDGEITSMGFEYTISPLTEKPAMLADSATDIFGLKERDLAKLIFKIEESLMNNPDFMDLFQ